MSNSGLKSTARMNKRARNLLQLASQVTEVSSQAQISAARGGVHWVPPQSMLCTGCTSVNAYCGGASLKFLLLLIIAWLETPHWPILWVWLVPYPFVEFQGRSCRLCQEPLFMVPNGVDDFCKMVVIEYLGLFYSAQRKNKENFVLKT